MSEKCETCKRKTISDCLLEIGQLRIEREELKKRIAELEFSHEVNVVVESSTPVGSKFTEVTIRKSEPEVEQLKKQNAEMRLALTCIKKYMSDTSLEEIGCLSSNAAKFAFMYLMEGKK